MTEHGGEIHGRRAELTAIDRVAAAARRGDGTCLVIEGAAGSGRTTLLDAAVARLAGSALVVRSAASEDDQVLAYAALADLCAPLQHHLDELPDLQQRALRGAIALGPAAGDRLAVAAGFLSLLRTAAEGEPLVVVALDDADRLDDGSATAMTYAARRLAGSPILMLVTQDPKGAARVALPGVARIELGPLAFDDAIALVGDLTPTAPRAVAEALIGTTHGLPGRLARAARAAGPDPGGATIDLDAASQRAQARNSPADEAAVHERTADTSEGAERVGALLQAGEAWLAAGRPERALAAGEAALACDPEHTGAGSKLLVARALLASGSGREARRALDEAAEHARRVGEREVAARALLLALPMHLHLGRIADAQRSLEDARSLLEPAPSTPREIDLLVRAAEIGIALASGDAVDANELVGLLDAGLRAPGRSDVPVIVTSVVMPLVWADRLAAARHVLEAIIARTRAQGALGLLALPLAALATLERRSGRSARALAAAAEAEQLAEEIGDHVALTFARTELANVLAQRGDAHRARALAGSLLRGDRPVRGTLEASARSALATVELIEGRWQEVIDLLEPIAASDAANLSPVVTLYQQNLAVAYARVGRRAEAQAIVEVIEQAARAAGGRLPAVVERCRGMLAPSGEYDAHFARAASLVGGNPLGVAITRLLHALRMLDDGRTTDAMAVLAELAADPDENALGVARTARRTLEGLGVGLARRGSPVEQLTDEELRVSLASLDGQEIRAIADELRTTVGEVTRIRADAFRTLGVHTTDELRAALGAGEDHEEPSTQLRLLGGLALERDGRAFDIPAGAVATTLALVALRRTVHVEQLVEVLWPGIAPDVGRRRIRNVLARLRAAAGPVVVRRGERLALEPSVSVDVHELDAALEVALDRRRPDADRDDARARALRLYRGVLLPELPFAEWVEPDRARLAMARGDLLRGLVEQAASHGAPDEALAVAEQALASEPDDEDLLVRAAELAVAAGRQSRARGLLRRAQERRALLGVPGSPRLDDLARRIEQP